MQVKHADSLALSDAPRSPARLPQSVERISGFIEDQRGVAQQIKARLDNFWVTDRDLDIFVKLLFEPGLPSPHRTGAFFKYVVEQLAAFQHYHTRHGPPGR
jgi:hypothetical protein